MGKLSHITYNLGAANDFISVGMEDTIVAIVELVEFVHRVR